ncbi:MAG: hypothetical protein AAF823_05935 [Planctomycetota bacterium]
MPLSADAERVVYREIFPVAEGEATKLTEAGWQAWVYSADDARVHRGAANYVALMRGQPSQPTDALPVNADVAADASIETGMMVNWNGGDFWPNPTLYLTEEFELGEADELTRVSWFQNNQSEQGGFRVALRVGTTWVISDQNFIGYGQRSLDLADAAWRQLDPADLGIDADAALSELPDGPITAFGMFGVHSGYAELDTFTLHARPEVEP